MELLASTVDITPRTPTPLASAPDPRRLSEGVSEPLEANVAVISDASMTSPIVLVTVDLLYPGVALRSALESALAEIPPSHIWIAASHTHRAPMSSTMKDGLGAFHASYVETIVSLLVPTVRRLLASAMEPVHGVVAERQLAHSVNRRRPGFRVSKRGPRRLMLLGPNPSGPKDETATLLVFRSASGDVRCVIWNYACHPVGHFSAALVSAHYPHVVRQALRSRLGSDDIPVLFLQGFSGDTRPSATAIAPRLRRWTRLLLKGNGFADMTRDEYKKWTEELADVVSSATAGGASLDDGDLKVAHRSVPLQQIVLGPSSTTDFEVRALRLGHSLTILGANAEVVSEYAIRLRQRSRSASIMLAGCLDDTYGYLPTARMVAEGGYEGGGFCASFGLEAVNPDCEAVAMDAFLSALDDVERRDLDD